MIIYSRSIQHVTTYDRHLVFSTEYDSQLCASVCCAMKSSLLTATCCSCPRNAEMPVHHYDVSVVPLAQLNYFPLITYWYFQPCFSTSILPPGVPCYLNETCRLRISWPSVVKHIPVCGAHIWLHVGDDQARGTMLYVHARIHVATEAQGS